MRSLLLVFLLAAGLTRARAQETDDVHVHLSHPAVREELVTVVTAQLAAFRADDWDRAYGLAARAFQNVIDPRQFVRLITRTYPVVWKNQRAEFGIPSDNGHIAVVPVRIFGENASEAYNWLLIKEGDVWRISGVVPQRTAGGA